MEVNVDAPNRSPDREVWFKVVMLSACGPACYPSTHVVVGSVVVDKVHMNYISLWGHIHNHNCGFGTTSGTDSWPSPILLSLLSLKG